MHICCPVCEGPWPGAALSQRVFLCLCASGISLGLGRRQTSTNIHYITSTHKCTCAGLTDPATTCFVQLSPSLDAGCLSSEVILRNPLMCVCPRVFVSVCMCVTIVFYMGKAVSVCMCLYDRTFNSVTNEGLVYVLVMDPILFFIFLTCKRLCMCVAATSHNTVRVCRFTNCYVDYSPGRVMEEQTSHYTENILYSFSSITGHNSELL